MSKHVNTSPTRYTPKVVEKGGICAVESVRELVKENHMTAIFSYAKALLDGSQRKRG